jgi:hypothetical protein
VVEFGVIADTGKQVQYLAVVCRGISHTIGCKHRQLQCAGDPKRSLIAPLFFALTVPLQLDIDAIRAKDADQPLDRLTASFLTASR